MLEQISTSIADFAVFLASSDRLPMPLAEGDVKTDVYKCPVGQTPSKIKTDQDATPLPNSNGTAWQYVVSGADVGTVPADFLFIFKVGTGVNVMERAITKRFSVGRAGIGAFGQPLPELTVGQPPTTPTLSQATMLNYMSQRNKVVSTSTAMTLHNAAGTPITVSAIGDDGQTYSRQALGVIG